MKTFLIVFKSPTVTAGGIAWTANNSGQAVDDFVEAHPARVPTGIVDITNLQPGQWNHLWSVESTTPKYRVKGRT